MNEDDIIYFMIDEFKEDITSQYYSKYANLDRDILYHYFKSKLTEKFKGKE